MSMFRYLPLAPGEWAPRHVLRLLASLGRLCACRRGNIAVEFGLMLPILVTFMVGIGEVGRFVLVKQKIDRVSASIGDLVARSDTLTRSELDDIFEAADAVAAPFDFSREGQIIVSSIVRDGSGPEIVWQREGRGDLGASSRLGRQGGRASFPNGFTLREGEAVIVAETFFDFEPVLGDIMIKPRQLYATAFHRPRLGTVELQR